MLKGIKLGTTVTGAKAKAEAVVKSGSATKTSAIAYKFNEGFNNVIYSSFWKFMTETLKKGLLLFIAVINVIVLCFLSQTVRRPILIKHLLIRH